MESKARLLNTFRDIETNKTVVTLEIEDSPAELAQWKDKDISVEIKQWRDPRSDKANRLMWACLTELAQAQRPPITKWEAYLKALRDYGQSTYVVMPPKAAERFAEQWREVDIVGEIDVNGRKGVQMHCYYGSSLYDTREFSILLDGIIEDMRNVGLKLPPDERVREALEEWEKAYCKKTKSATSAAEAGGSSATTS